MKKNQKKKELKIHPSLLSHGVWYRQACGHFKEQEKVGNKDLQLERAASKYLLLRRERT